MPRSAQPEIPAFLKSYGIHVPDLAPVFHWLHDQAGLTWAEIAVAFRITPARLRAIVSRNPSIQERAPLPGSLDRFEVQLLDGPLVLTPSPELREALGISPDRDEVVYSNKRIEEIKEFELGIETDQQLYASSGRYEDGLLRMRSNIRKLGEPHSALLVRILARLRHHSAWFLVHLGRTRTAIDQARRSMALSATALHECGESIDLIHIADAALILSMAYQLRNMPEASLKVLATVSTIHRRFGTDGGSEYFRQLGTAQMQLLEDDAAVKSLGQSADAGRRDGLPPATVALNSTRQITLLNRPQWQGSRDTLADATRGIPESDIRYAMNVHWRVATGLATGDAKMVDRAMELLGPKPPAYFGHQATIRYLLELTPRIGLEGETLKRWIRYLLYANVFRDE
jgi:hypothetical protein